MAFLGSIGKFLGGAVKAVGPILAPVASFATDIGLKKLGIGGGGLTGFLPGAGGPPSISTGTGIFDSFQTSLGGPYQFPRTIGQPVSQQQAIPVASTMLAVPAEIFDLLLVLVRRLGLRVTSSASVVRLGRSVLAKLLRFARANPGLTILNLLINLGFAAHEANMLVTWFTTHGKRRRRIKVTNVKALNRSVRRLEGFRRLSHRVEAALARRGSVRTIGRTRRCPRCRKNPCCC